MAPDRLCACAPDPPESRSHRPAPPPASSAACHTAMHDAHRGRRRRAGAPMGASPTIVAVAMRLAVVIERVASLGEVFDHVAIAVSDLAASERFYRTVL